MKHSQGKEVVESLRDSVVAVAVGTEIGTADLEAQGLGGVGRNGDGRVGVDVVGSVELGAVEGLEEDFEGDAGGWWEGFLLLF